MVADGGRPVPPRAGWSTRPAGSAAGRLVDAAGNLLILAAALTLILRRGSGDLGGVIDSAVIAFAAGSLLWAVFPHRIGTDASFPAQVDQFVVVFALTGVLGALLRLARTAAEPGRALRWLLIAIGLAIVGNLLRSVADTDTVWHGVADVLILGAFTATGLFGLDPDAPRVVYPQDAVVERLSAGRLAFLGAAVAVVPVVIGVRELIAAGAAGLLLAVQGVLVAILVMRRVGLLSVQWTRAEQALAHQATHDSLTPLPNRQELVTRLRDELRRGARCVLLFCDLDGFKLINDQYGHEAGDRLLVEVARRLRACIDPPNLVCRFGGDEFVVLLIDATLAEGEARRACIASAMRRPIDVAGGVGTGGVGTGGVGIGISIGLAQTGPDRDPDHVIRVADRDMYRVKASAAARAVRGQKSSYLDVWSAREQADEGAAGDVALFGGAPNLLGGWMSLQPQRLNQGVQVEEESVRVVPAGRLRSTPTLRAEVVGPFPSALRGVALGHLGRVRIDPGDQPVQEGLPAGVGVLAEQDQLGRFLRRGRPLQRRRDVAVGPGVPVRHEVMIVECGAAQLDTGHGARLPGLRAVNCDLRHTTTSWPCPTPDVAG